ncbi:unnamed protein product [Cladocopium goreaui]|uniref:Ion transport domain-containing protein n=1 Tax=Cladocopium goreaui TaxID=2562237 RepID=A0A9P1C084_9DINO|nr:unnamed protein product [Cladocopium goreaui]
MKPDQKLRGFSLVDEEIPHPRSKEDRLRTNTPSLMTLLELQGLVVPEDGDIMSVQLKPHQCWDKKTERLALQSGTMRSRKILWTTSGTSEEKKDPQASCMRWMWLHPSGGFRACWNSLVALLVLYDLLVIPLSVFDHPKSSAMHAMDIGMPIFWSMDFILTFFTGYYQQGELISDFKKIAYQYAMRWMLYDLGLIALDWIFVTMDYFMPLVSETGWSRSLLMLRILRLARIMRAIKLRRGFATFQDLLHSQAFEDFLPPFCFLAFLAGRKSLRRIFHQFGAAADFEPLDGLRLVWSAVVTPKRQLGGEERDEPELLDSYLMCMLWSFCQLGVGESPLQPTNTTEMLLNCVIAFRALITTATLISTMSDLIAGLRSLREDEAAQFRLLRRFLAQNNIPHDVSHKVTQFLQHQFTNAQKARSSDLRVPLLDLLSRPLFRELQFERHRASLSKLPMLKDLLEAPDIQTLEAVHSTTSSLQQLVAAAGDIIFLSGSRASSAYMKLDGTLSYYRDQGEELVNDQVWVAEACLWTPWIHMGDFEAEEVSDLLCLDADGFCAIMSKTWSTQQMANSYARQFLAAMQRDRIWSDVYVDHELDSVNGEDDLPLELPLVPLFCGFCPRLKRRRDITRVQNVLPDEASVEPDLT